MVRRRVLIYSGNRTSGSLNNYEITLPITLKNINYIEWVSSSQVGFLVSIRDFNESVSSGGTMYWRFIDAFTNVNLDHFNPSEISGGYQKSTRTLNFAFFNPDGSSATIPTEHTLELEVLCDE
jgi:hypothetical protein